MSNPSSMVTRPRSGISEEQARDIRVRAWAYVFSCWHAKQKAMPSQIAGDHSNGSTASEVSHVERSTDEASSIVHHLFTKENE